MVRPFKPWENSSEDDSPWACARGLAPAQAVIGRACSPQSSPPRLGVSAVNQFPGSAESRLCSAGILSYSAGVLSYPAGILSYSTGKLFPSAGVLSYSTGKLFSSAGILAGSTGILSRFAGFPALRGRWLSAREGRLGIIGRMRQANSSQSRAVLAGYKTVGLEESVRDRKSVV